jgi:hypothetical protein
MLSALVLLSASDLKNESLPGHPDLVQRLRYFECFNVVGIVERLLREAKQTAAISNELTEHCGKLPNSRKTVCLALVPASVDTIIAQVTNMTRPEAVCEGLGFKRPLTGARVFTAEQCAKYVDLLRAEPSDLALKKGPLPKPFKTKTGELGKATLASRSGASAVCKGLPIEQKLACNIISRIVSHRFSADVQKGIPAAEICQKVHDKHLIKIVQAPPKADGAAPALAVA